MSHVSTNFIGPSLGNSFFYVGNGTSARTIQISIPAYPYDRVIYVYSDSNSNNYYCQHGFFEIEIDIKKNLGNNVFSTQQIFTYFFSQPMIKPSGIGYSYILPAGLSSTISLLKGSINTTNGLQWLPMPGYTGNYLNGPRIYATSLKFGL
jgi:hypothetical protein